MRSRTTTLAAALAALIVAAPAGTPDAHAAGEFFEAMKIVKDPKLLATRADDAEKLLSTCLVDHPLNHQGWYNLGLLQQRRGDLAGAEASWKKALAAKPDFKPALARLAWLDIQRGNVEGGTAQLEALTKDDRFQPEARNLLSELAISRGDYAKAKEHARNVLLGDRENINALLNVAIAYFREGLYDQAALVAENALTKQPDAGALHNILGLVYLQKDNTRKATEHFGEALAIDPSNLDAKLNLAALELAYGNFASALARFDEVVALRPDDAMLQMSRAVALRGLERYDEARQGYEKTLALKPGFDEAEYNLCVLHQQFTNDWAAAKRHCGVYASKIDRTHPKFREMKKRNKAIDATLKALQKTGPVKPPTTP